MKPALFEQFFEMIPIYSLIFQVKPQQPMSPLITSYAATFEALMNRVLHPPFSREKDSIHQNGNSKKIEIYEVGHFSSLFKK